MTIPFAPDSPLTRAAEHLYAAIFLAGERARGDSDEMLSPWANTADTITLAVMGLAPSLAGPVEPAQHHDCRSALLAAANELAQLRPGIDAPLADLMFVLEYLLPALQHAHDDAAEPESNRRVQPTQTNPA